uniref:Transmembrane protein 273 n=1 Tax=Peromyscus maniculatus bairdii TaxID=230844 RepID=A0A8C8UNN2_PERMB
MSRVPILRVLLFLVGVGGAQVLEMDKSAGTAIDTILQKKRRPRDARVIEL